MVNRAHACHTIQTKQQLGILAIYCYPRGYILLSENLIGPYDWLAYFASGDGHASIFGRWVKSPEIPLFL